jgi:hypothetical protein
MKTLGRLLSICSAILLLGTPLADAQVFPPSLFQGNTWNQNVNNGPWAPQVSAGVATFTGSDTQWRQVRSITNYPGSVRTAFEIKLELASGGPNGDLAFVGFGQEWIYYRENPEGDWVPGPGTNSLALLFQQGSIYIADCYGTPRQVLVPIGNYVQSQWLQFTLDLSASGYFQIFGPGISTAYHTTNLLSPRKFIVAESGSTDGFQMRNVSVAAASAAAPFDVACWQGNRWSRNVNKGPWFPGLAGLSATFASDDSSWVQTRTTDSFIGSARVTLEIKPALLSGGVNGDEACFGFGEHWCYYHVNPVGTWVPGPGPAFVGIMLSDGKIWIVDGYGVAPNYRQQIGVYTPGQWLPITLDLSPRGVLRVMAPGVNASFTTSSLSSTNRFIIANGNSEDGFEVRNVALGASGNLLTTCQIQTYVGADALDGIPGQTYEIRSTLSLTPPVVWKVEAEFVMSESGFRWVDTAAPANGPKKFYTIVPKP